MAEHKAALLQDQVDVQQDKIIQLESQIEAFLTQKLEGERMIQDLMQKKNTEISNLGSTVRTLTDQLELLRTSLDTFKSVNGV